MNCEIGLEVNLEQNGLNSGSRILVIEDDHKVAGLVESGLVEEGFVVELAVDGLRGTELALEGRFDLLIVDIMLPERDGLTLIETVRECGCQTPILVLSARHRVDDRVKGLGMGGDDYLTKPFAFAELLARVRALLRRAEARQPEATVLTVGPMALNLLTRQVTRENKTIDLQNKEFELLAYLMRHEGLVVSKGMIIKNVWKYQFDPQTNIVEVRISKLREKLDQGFHQKMIVTIRGGGYMLRNPTETKQ